MHANCFTLPRYAIDTEKILFLNIEVLITNKESQKSVFSAVKMKTFFP